MHRIGFVACFALAACSRTADHATASEPSAAPPSPASATLLAPVPASAAAPPAPMLPPPDVPPLASGVVVRLFVDVQLGQLATVRGETNLPDGTEMMVDIGEPGDFGRLGGSDKTAVAGGRFRSQGLGPDGGFPEGDYVVSVVMPIADVQPPAVQAIIGAHGERLKGPLVKHDTMGTNVETESPFIVGDPKRAPATGRARRQATRTYVQTVLGEFRAMLQRARSADHSEEAWADGSCMQRARSEWARLEPRSKELDKTAIMIPGVSEMRAAHLYLHDCASCAKDYARGCADAKEQLDEAAAEFSKAAFK